MLARSKEKRERAYNRRFNSICEWPRRWSISNAAEPRAGLSKARRKAKRTAERGSTRDSIYTVRERIAHVGVNYPRHREARLCTAIRWPIARSQLFSLDVLLPLFPFFTRSPLLLFFSISRRVEHNPTPAPAGKRVADLGTNSHSSTCVQRSVCARVKARKKLLLNAFQVKLLLVGIKESYLTRHRSTPRPSLRRLFGHPLVRSSSNLPSVRSPPKSTANRRGDRTGIEAREIPR